MSTYVPMSFQVFSQMFLLGMRIKFNDFLHVLNATANEMAENVKMLEKTGMSLSYISISKKLVFSSNSFPKK